MKPLVLTLVFSLALVFPALATSTEPSVSLRVPALTAYIEPDAEALEVAAPGDFTGWTAAREKVVWYGRLNSTGRLGLAVSLRLPETAASTLRLTVAKMPRGAVGSRTAQTRGGSGAQPITVDFGSVDIPSPGYYRFALEGVSKTGPTFGDPETLLLGGPVAKDAQFNLKTSRGAPSVHLWYPVPRDVQVEWFYNEVTVKADPLWSYYMACGFRRGYFGIQVNSPTERRIIFSVWDSGHEPADRGKVAPEDRVQLVAKGDGVFAGSFGNEGTGGHSHLVYPWKTGRTYRFLVSARPEGASTLYSGYFYFPEQQRWGLIASFRAPQDGGYLNGLYSFNEDFNGANGQKRRLAEFGPQWIKTADGRWTELLSARFTHTSDAYKDRLDRGAGVVDGRFYLSNGGFLAAPSIRYGDVLQRPPSGKPPADIVLPP
jgi:hypothetical protein